MIKFIEQKLCKHDFEHDYSKTIFIDGKRIMAHRKKCSKCGKVKNV